MKKRISAMNSGLTRRGFLHAATAGAAAAVGLPAIVAGVFNPPPADLWRTDDTKRLDPEKECL